VTRSLWEVSTVLYITILLSADLLVISVGLRVEWGKSKARHERWEENVAIISAEMCRAVDFARAQAVQWRQVAEQIHPCSTPDIYNDHTALVEGRRAYARERALLYDAWGNDWAVKWTPVLRSASKTRLAYLISDFGGRARTSVDPVVIDLSGSDVRDADNNAREEGLQSSTANPNSTSAYH
jgi:hypothetical protein